MCLSFNTSQNYNEVLPHNSHNGPSSESLQITDAGEGIEKREASYTLGENVS